MKRKLLSLAIAFSLLSQTLVSAGAIYDWLQTGNYSGSPTQSFYDSSNRFSWTNFGATATTKNATDKVAGEKVKSQVKGEVRASASDAYSSYTSSSTFDYKLSIDMTNVKKAFNDLYSYSEAAITLKDPSGTEGLQTKFDNSKVIGTFTINVRYSAGITPPVVTSPSSIVLNQTGGSASPTYTIASATDDGTGNITITVNANTTIADLSAPTSTILNDLYVEMSGWTATIQNSTITADMSGATIIKENTDPATDEEYAIIDYTSDPSVVTVYRSSSSHGGGGSQSNAPVANADSGDNLVDLPVSRVGSDYYVTVSDLPDEDSDGNTIYGWYIDEARTIPVVVDKNGRIKITQNTVFFSRTIPIASTVMDNVTDAVVVNSSDDGTFTVDMTTLPTQDNEGHTIYGWDLDEEHTTPAKPNASGILGITSDTFLYPRTEPIALTVVGTQLGSVPVLRVADGIFTIDVDKIDKPSQDGFAFVGWYTEPNFINSVSGTTNITKDTYLYPRYVNITPPEQMISDEHILYVYGYPDGEVKPNNYITREEVAAIFCRLLDPEYRATIEADENSFPDVENGRWSNREISTMAKGGYIVGDENGYFNPSNPITRAEFTVIASKFAGVDTFAENNFTDIEGHWAKDYILKAASQYWITGYEDLTFRPQNKITRAEAMTIVNSMLVRYGDHDSEYAKQWPDLKKTDWYYDQVIEATSHNYYTRNEDGWSETWIYADEDNNSHAR